MALTIPNIQNLCQALSLPYSIKKLIWNYETERDYVLPELQEIWSYFHLTVLNRLITNHGKLIQSPFRAGIQILWVRY